MFIYVRQRISLVLLFLVLFSSFSISQDDERYLRESKAFIQFVRDSVFSNNKYSVLKNKDSVVIRNYLWNKKLFGGLALALINSKSALLTKKELDEIIQKIHSDSSKHPISSNFIKHTKLVEDTTSQCIFLSTPIFIRNYAFCIFSWGMNESNITILFKKRKSKWVILKVIGEISDI